MSLNQHHGETIMSVHMNVNVPDDQVRQIRNHAVEADLTISQIIRKAIKKYLAEIQKESQTGSTVENGEKSAGAGGK